MQFVFILLLLLVVPLPVNRDVQLVLETEEAPQAGPQIAIETALPNGGAAPWVCPGIIRVNLSGMTPGGAVAIAWDFFAAPSTIQGPVCNNAPIPLLSPTVVRVLVADAAGNISYETPVPLIGCLVEICGFDITTCVATIAVPL